MSKKGKTPVIIPPSEAPSIVPASESDLTAENIERIRKQAHRAVGAPLITDFALSAQNFDRYAKQLGAYRFTLGHIFYRRPDHPAVLQEYIWTDLDIAPRYPVLNKFLDFWRRELEGPLHSVKVDSQDVFRAPTIGGGFLIALN
jgi:uncharacterized protein Usg